MSETMELIEAPAEAPREKHPMLGVVGLHAGIPEEEYHEGPGLSQSKLKLFREAPAKARWAENKESKAKLVGSAVHRIILEPERWQAEYTVFQHPGNTKAGKAEREDAAKAGLIGITQLQCDTALGCARALREHPTAGKLLDIEDPDTEREQTAYVRDPDTGLLLRARFDILNRRLRCINDVKTTGEGADMYEFGRAAGRFRYDFQAAYYLKIAALLDIDIDFFAFSVVEKEVPHLVAAYDLEHPDLEVASDELKRLLASYAECERTDTWPGYPTHLQRLVLPRWLNSNNG